jgi:hypothetical protein
MGKEVNKLASNQQMLLTKQRKMKTTKEPLDVNAQFELEKNGHVRGKK